MEIHAQITTERDEQLIRAEKVLIAVGTIPAHREGIPFDGTHIVDR
jgi:pyruvate/2-oxoglutarate dehydrogenase complex dihydrolipoamide dehydrogenase (E3) component